MGTSKLSTGREASDPGSLPLCLQELQLPGLVLKVLPNSRAYVHPHTFPAFLILPGQGEV